MYSGGAFGFPTAQWSRRLVAYRQVPPRVKRGHYEISDPAVSVGSIRFLCSSHFLDPACNQLFANRVRLTTLCSNQSRGREGQIVLETGGVPARTAEWRRPFRASINCHLRGGCKTTLPAFNKTKRESVKKTKTWEHPLNDGDLEPIFLAETSSGRGARDVRRRTTTFARRLVSDNRSGWVCLGVVLGQDGKAILRARSCSSHILPGQIRTWTSLAILSLGIGRL